MRNYFRSFTLLIAAVSTPVATGCTEEPPSYGAYPAADEDVASVVTKQQAAATGATALDGLSTGSLERWTTSWSPAMRAALDESTFQRIRDGVLEQYGAYRGMTQTRVGLANTPGYVRFSFLAEFENGALMLVHNYPQDDSQITGVHLRDAETGEIPAILQ